MTEPSIGSVACTDMLDPLAFESISAILVGRPHDTDSCSGYAYEYEQS
jgi:hypothetical protein